MNYKPVDQDFEFATMTEDELITIWKQCYPGGSGPLGMMRLFCRAVESVGHLRGFDVSKWS